MNVVKRILAGLTLLLGAAMLLLGLAGGVGVWVVKGPVTERAARVFERVEAALDVADQSLEHAQTSLGTAAERLDGVREEQRQVARAPSKTAALKRTMARTVQRRVAPEVGDAHQKLHAVAEAAVVVNSVLEDLGNFPLLSTSGLDTSQLTEINAGLAGVAPAAWELSRLFGEPGADAAAADELSRVDRLLKRARRLIAEYQSQVTQTRGRVEALKSKVFRWVTPAAALVSFVCFWVALSQISLLSRAWSWWRQSGRPLPPS